MIRLVPSAGPRAGRAIALDDGARLGRLPDCELPVAHASVSRVHARIERRADGWYLVDADSRNGVFTGGRRVPEVRLVPGARVRLGEFELEVAGDAAAGGEPVGDGAVIDEEIEFDLDGGIGDAPAEADAEDGIELEDPADIDIGSDIGSGDAARPSAAAPAARSAAATATVAATGAGGASTARERSAQYLAEESRARGGLVRGELTQQPAWIQALAFAGVLLLGAAIAWGVFVGVTA